MTLDLAQFIPGIISGGSVGAVLTFIIARRKIEVGREASLVGPLNARIAHLERMVSELSHRLNSAVTEADSLLLAVKYAPPAAIPQIVAEVEAKRAAASAHQREDRDLAA
jgi:pyrroline-5-carboxylate reductase